MLGNIGRSVSLPCNTTSTPSRTVALVMWFKGDSEDPFYSLDLRQVRSAEAATHWADQGWAEKVKFHFEEVRSEISGAEQSQSVWSTLIGRGSTRLGSHWSRAS